jgi:hypothetical protein
LLPASYSLPGKSATDEEFEISDRWRIWKGKDNQYLTPTYRQMEVCTYAKSMWHTLQAIKKRKAYKHT